MTIEEIETKQLELAKAIEKYKSEQAKSEVKTIYNLQDDDEYWYVDNNGEIGKFTWDKDDKCDDGRLAIGNVFLTELEAKRAKALLEVNAAMRRMSEEAGGVDWNNIRKLKWCFYYSHCEQEIVFDSFVYLQYNTIYFPTEELARQAIDLYGNKWLFAKGIKESY